MIVDDPECLRSWLTEVLRPLCDADPAALAKYVLALIKKDKTDEELKQGMIDQLDVFLQNETRGFVDVLFKVLVTKEYLGASDSAMGDESVINVTSSSSSSSKSSHSSSSKSASSVTIADTSSSSAISLQGSNGSLVINAIEDPDITGVVPEERSDFLFRKDNIKKEKDGSSDEKERDRNSRRNKSRSPRRNSKTTDRVRRSRSPRDYRPRYRGRKSPIRRYDRPERDVWDRRRSPPARNRSASPRRRASPRYPRRSNTRSRSPIAPRSPKETKDIIPVDVSPRFEVKVEDNIDQKPASSAMIVAHDSSQVSDGYSNNANAPQAGSGTNRCRDFDERGLCMRGELCQYDHGAHPVVLADALARQAALKAAAEAQELGNQGPPYHPMMFPPGMMRQPRPQMLEPHGWNMAPGFRPRHNGRGRGGMVRHYMGLPPRELINVPVVGHPVPEMRSPEFHPMPPMMGPRGMHPRGMHMGRGRGSGRGFFDHARLGAKTYRNNLNCSLEVKRIPSNQNNIMDLNSHFWRFGKIVNIQISFEGDPEAALITFSTPAEAFAAYRSTEAVLNNRFVKVFWHNKEKENEEGDGAPGTVSVKDRLGPGGESQHEAMEEDKILLSGNSLTKTVYNHNAVRKELAQEKVEAVEAIKRSQEMLAAQEVLKREQAEKKKEAMLMRNNLQKRKQDVLSEQIDQQKKLIQKIESGKGVMKPEEISQLMEIVKSLQESIEKIKLDLDKSANPIHTGQKPQNPIPAAPPSRNKEETQKEILDAELDLYNKELEGGDTLALKRKVLELRSQAQAAGLLRGRGGYRGLLRSFTNRGRGAMRSLRRVDRRPTKICITGHPLSKSSEILAHFAQYGLMENYETDPVKPSLTIKYETRKSAELAMSQGRNVQNIPLDIQWVANSVASNQDKQGSRNSTNGEEESTQEELDNGDDGDDELADAYVDQLDLYDQYEDEEDDEDDRTWRR